MGRGTDRNRRVAKERQTISLGLLSVSVAMLSESCIPYTMGTNLALLRNAHVRVLKEPVRPTEGTIIGRGRSTSHTLVSPPAIRPAALLFRGCLNLEITHFLSVC